MDNEKKIEEVEVDALTDQDLEEVAGGRMLADSCDTCCSCSGCSNAN